MLKALKKLFYDPPPKLIGMVRNIIGDSSTKSTQLKDAIRGLWAERQEIGNSNRLHLFRKGPDVGPVGNTGNKAALTGKAYYDISTHRVIRQAKIQHPPVKSLDGTLAFVFPLLEI